MHGCICACALGVYMGMHVFARLDVLGFNFIETGSYVRSLGWTQTSEYIENIYFYYLLI